MPKPKDRFVTVLGPHTGERVKVWKITAQKVLFFRLAGSGNTRTNPITQPLPIFLAQHRPLNS